MYLPIGTPPVKVTRSTSGLRQHLVGDLARIAGDHRQHLGGGSPASYRMSASAQCGQRRLLASASSTMRLLVAIAGATLWITWFSGWLNGVIAVITPEQRLAQRVDACAACRGA